jgi:hypothetical protein
VGEYTAVSGVVGRDGARARVSEVACRVSRRTCGCADLERGEGASKGVYVLPAACVVRYVVRADTIARVITIVATRVAGVAAQPEGGGTQTHTRAISQGDHAAR